jgi:hypothetical protein
LGQKLGLLGEKLGFLGQNRSFRDKTGPLVTKQDILGKKDPFVGPGPSKMDLLTKNYHMFPPTGKLISTWAQVDPNDII